MTMTATGAGPSLNNVARHTILTITNASSKTLFTTQGPHGLSGGETIVVTGNSVAAYNTTHTGVAVQSATTFKTGFGYTSNGTGGRWD
jgi:6-phosphofructokinase